MRVILSVGRYFKRHYGIKVRKIPISLPGFTCPNIDGYLAKGGCIYCDNESFSPSLATINKNDSIKMNFTIDKNPLLQKQLDTLEAQFKWHAKYHKETFGIAKYMIYFQSYTNTYAPLDTLKALWDRSMILPNVIGMSIGTRIDCVDDKMLEILSEYVKNGKEIWLEYGIQSIYDETLKATNRAHKIDGAKELFAKTRAKGIKVCAHLIYGLPKDESGERESKEMMLNSLKTIVGYGVDSLKIHPLYVIDHTRLARLYKDGRYRPIELEEYTELIIESIKLIPPEVMIQRLSAGAHEDSLLAPKWCFDKNIQMRYIRDKLAEAGYEY